MAVPIFFILLALTAVAGWINNVIWTFHQSALTDLILGVLGVFAAPIGAIHGIYLWFV